MKKLAFLASILLAVGGVGGASSEVSIDVGGPGSVLVRPPDECSSTPHVVQIREADPAVDRAHHDQMRSLFIKSAGETDTTILLGPNVVLDFTPVPNEPLPVEVPVSIGRCVTIRSVASFKRSPGETVGGPTGGVATRRAPGDVAPERGPSPRVRVRPPTGAIVGADRPGVLAGEPAPPQPIPEARSSTAPGPLLKFGPHRSDGNRAFLLIACSVEDTAPHDHVRISGFRLYGPSFGEQHVGDKGILIDHCVDIEVFNMEIAGFGGEGVRVQDATNEDYTPPLLAEPWQLRKLPGACREAPYNGPGGRIGSPNQVRIFNNYIHHNQQPRTITIGHAGGYGVEVTYGAWAQIYQNLFSYNRHAIAAGGTMGGYEATRNLVLRYGGIHYDGAITIHTHAFDIHGTGENGFKGFAGTRTLYSENAFQFRKGAAISIRGSPRCGVEISHNVFPHPGLENDWGDDAVKLEYRQDLDIVRLGPSNALNTNTYGQYDVCDLDGDGIDDLFLATGVSWWFSGMGEFPWRFLAARTERLNQVRLGYFDEDNKCDVLTESGGRWVISSGGIGAWHVIGDSFAPLSQVHFGRFDPSQRDHRPGATRRTTHAFWRTPSGQWKITTLTGPNQGWREIGSSRVPMSDLRFGDFTGDGVTDVLAVVGGHWSISESAAGRWRTLNPTLSDDVRSLYIVDINNDNIDDILRAERKPIGIGSPRAHETYNWLVSYGGSTPWRPLKSYSWVAPDPSGSLLPPLFVGRFGMAHGGAILTVDPVGIGRFYGPKEAAAGASPDWSSTFSY